MTYTSFNDWVSAFKGVQPSAPGCASLEKLPTEILNQVLQYVTMSDSTQKSFWMKDNLPVSPNTRFERSSLLYCMLVSRRLFEVALPLTYYCPKVSSFSKFVDVFHDRPAYGTFIRSLDLSNVPENTNFDKLPTWLSSYPLIRRISLPLDAFKASGLATTVFFGSQQITSVEVDGASSKSRQEILGSRSFDNLQADTTSLITSLYLNGFDCDNLSQLLLPRCPNLRILEMKHDYVVGDILWTLSSSTRLTHLKLDCKYPANGLVDFFTNHPAVKDSLKLLDVTLHPFFPLESQAFQTILQNIPPTLRSLRILNKEMAPSSIPILRKLSIQLKELSIGYEGRGLSLQDLEEVLLGSQYDLSNSAIQTSPTRETSTDPHLGTIANAVTICKLQQRVNAIPRKYGNHASMSGSRVRHLDLRNMSLTVRNLKVSLLLGPHSLPLQTIELPEDSIPDHREFAHFCTIVGWELHMVGDRIWIERK